MERAKRVLAISSLVARGHVGNSAAVPALQRLGHEVWSLPTVILSNHPGHARVAGTRLQPETLQTMLEALAANGWLAEVDAVLTGYLPSAGHVTFAADAITRLRGGRPDLLVLCDTVLGDDPGGLYIEEEAALAVRDRLLPLADVATPNRFELAWLTRRAVGSCAQAASAARRLGPKHVLATSVPEQGAAMLHNVLTCGDETLVASVPLHGSAPHGTGDLLAGLLLGRMLDMPGDHRLALALAVAGVQAAIAASEGADELRLVQSQTLWADPEPWPVHSLADGM